MSEPLKRILAPLDGSPGSEAVFPAIMPLVRASSPQVELLYVFENPEAKFLPPERVTTACATLRTAGVKASLDLREGSPAEEILRAAREKKADLIALSTQGRGGVVRLLAGSVAEEVLRKADIPLLITRPGIVVRDWKSIVVALDGSVRAEEILPEAVRLARALGSTIEVLQVAVPVVAAVLADAPFVLPIEDPIPYLKGVVAMLELLGVKASAVALEGHPPGEILRHLRTSKASLLCMTTHGRSGLSRLLMGSVAEQVVRQSPCPVFLRRTLATDATVAEMVSRVGVVF